MTCNDCIHYELCQLDATQSNNKSFPLRVPELCSFFQNRSRFLELPIFDDYEEAKLLDIAIDYCYKVAMSSDPNIRVEYKAEHKRLCGWLGDLRRRIEAEQALKERESNV